MLSSLISFDISYVIIYVRHENLQNNIDKNRTRYSIKSNVYNECYTRRKDIDMHLQYGGECIQAIFPKIKKLAKYKFICILQKNYFEE